jgi:uncharacterized membrane protein
MMKNIIQKLTDKDLEIVMGNLLRFGVLLSATIVLVGAVIYLSQHGLEYPNYNTFLGEPKGLMNISSIWKATLQGNGKSIIQLGLLVLIATPIARIVFSIFGFIVEKDFLYTSITLLVLAVIIFSLL